MDLNLKQRLIGAVVLVSLAVIFIPLLLDGSGAPKIPEIPDPPRPTSTVAKRMLEQSQSKHPVEISSDHEQTAVLPRSTELVPPAIQAEHGALDESPKKSESQSMVVASPPTKAAANQSQTDTELGAWVVQVGSFGKKNKALELREQLRKMKFKAYVEPYHDPEQKVMYRVRVGPVLSYDEIQSVRKQLGKKAKLDGFIIQHP